MNANEFSSCALKTPGKVDVNEAREHGKYSRVRKIDKQLIVELKETDDVSRLFTRTGYPKCDAYSLACKPRELGDLGCGFPLLFDFIKFLLVLSAAHCTILFPVLAYVYNYWGHEESTSCSAFSRALGTAGCLNEKGRSSLLPAAMVLVATVVSIALIPTFSRRQQVVEKGAESDVLRPNSFAILVRGLPADATDDEEISSFFHRHALLDGKSASIVKVVIGFDVRQYYEHVKKQAALRKKLRRTHPGCEAEKAQLCMQIEKLEEKFNSLQSMRLNGTGFAVVIFRYQLEQRECLKRWSESWRGEIVRFLRHQAAPPNPYFRGQYRLQVERAPNPSDIHWENLAYSNLHRLAANGLTIATGAIIWFASLALSVLLLSLNVRIHNEDYDGAGLEWYRPVEDLLDNIDFSSIRSALRDPLNSKAHFGLLLVSFMPSVATTVINAGVWVILAYTSEFERHITVTGKETSTMVKLTLVFTLNTAASYLFVLNKPRWWYVRGGLVESVFVQLLICMFMEPLLVLLPPDWLYNKLRLLFIKPERTTLTQAEYNHLHEGPQFLTAGRLANVLKSFALSVMYLPVAPIGGFLGLCMWGIYYWSLKYMLLRRCKRPYLQSSILPYTALRLAQGSLVFVPLLGAYLLLPSFEPDIAAEIRILMVAGFAWALTFQFVPLKIQEKIFATKLCQPIKTKTLWETRTYYQAQHMFVDKYHKANPVYRSLPEETNPEILVEPEEIYSSANAAEIQNTGDDDTQANFQKRRRRACFGEPPSLEQLLRAPEAHTQLRRTIAAELDPYATAPTSAEGAEIVLPETLPQDLPQELYAAVKESVNRRRTTAKTFTPEDVSIRVTTPHGHAARKTSGCTPRRRFRKPGRSITTMRKKHQQRVRVRSKEVENLSSGTGIAARIQRRLRSTSTALWTPQLHSERLATEAIGLSAR